MDEDTDDLTLICLKLTELEASYLNAATCEFFHKMSSSKDVNLVNEDNYNASLNLWNKVKTQVKLY